MRYYLRVLILLAIAGGLILLFLESLWTYGLFATLFITAIVGSFIRFAAAVMNWRFG